MTRARRAAGLTLIEVLLATALVSMVVVSASWAMSHTSASKDVHAEETISAALLAKEIHELALTLPKAESGKAEAKKASDVTALDTLDGAAFTPPIDATGQEYTSLTGWRQDVSLGVHDVADLATEANDGFEELSPTSSKLFRLSVTISFRGENKGTWWWWLNP